MQQGQAQKGFSYAFKQQIMKAWQPVPTLNSTIVLFATMSVFFLTMGIVLISYSNSISAQEFQYDSFCSTLTPCQVDIALDSDYKAPVYFYYQLTNFYQNHRRYVKSKSPKQLSGTEMSTSELDECDPIITNDDMGLGGQPSVTGETLVGSDPAVPCGLIARSLFTDSFTLTHKGNQTQIPINSNGIAWPSDKDGRYVNVNLSKQWVDMENDERFMVWMRTAALPQFRKLWGRIDEDLKAGVYTLSIDNKYDVSAFNGKKYVVLSTTNAFGGKNEFLSIAYICVGVVCCVVTLGFIIRKFLSRAEQKKVR